MSENTNIKITKSYIDLALAMFISGSAVVAGKMMVADIPTFLAAELGILIGLMILVPFTFCATKSKLRLDGHTRLILFAQAFCGVFLYRIFTFIGLKFTSAAAGGLITSASPVVVLLLAYFLLREKITLNQIMAIISTVIGLLVINLSAYVSSDGHSSMKGNLLIMAAVFCEALFSILSKAKCKPLSALYRTTVIAIDAFLLLLPFAVYDAVHYDFGKMQLKTFFCIAYYGIFVSFLSYILWFRGIEKVQASNAAVFTSVVPISSTLLSVFLLREHLYLLHMISLVFILTGIWISVSNPIRQNSPE